MSQKSDTLSQIGKDLLKAVDLADQTLCEELVDAIEKEGSNMTIALLKSSNIGTLLGKALKGFRRHKRTDGTAWESLVESGTRLVHQWKSAVATEEKEKNKEARDIVNHLVGLPKSVSEYKDRLTKHSKELFKDPPVLPPTKIDVGTTQFGLPKRDPKSGVLFFPGVTKEFTPNQSPEQVLRGGSFGGTYFRPIHSAVTNVQYTSKDALESSIDPRWIVGIDKTMMLTSATYRVKVNKYGVKCGGSLGMWESSGWIAESDPYGWFQWYCRFYQGRRCSDDDRQISRWLKSAGPKGRFRSQLCNKILQAKAKFDDANISPVIRQTLLHWGLEIDDNVLEEHRKRVGR